MLPEWRSVLPALAFGASTSRGKILSTYQIKINEYSKGGKKVQLKEIRREYNDGYEVFSKRSK